MKKFFYSACIMLLSWFGLHYVTAAPAPMINQFALALAKQDQKQVHLLIPQFSKDASISTDLLKQQIHITEKILVRIFKTYKNLTPKFIDYLYFESMATQDETLMNEMTKNLLVSYLANENAKIYIKKSENVAPFLQRLQEKGAESSQIFVLDEPEKVIFQKIVEQIHQDYPSKTKFNIAENRVSLIVPSSEIKPRLALANAVFNRQFQGVEVDDFSYLDQPRENLQHNNATIRYKTFQAMLEGLE